MSSSAIKITHADEASEAWLALAAQVTFGEPGSRYRRLNVASQLERFHRPEFLSAWLDGELAGIYVLDRRWLRVEGQPVPGIYRALFAVRESHRGSGLGRALADHAMRWIDAQSRVAGTAVLSYGCIDATNAASLAVLAHQAAQRLDQLTSHLIYRQWPRRSNRLVEVPPAPCDEAADTWPHREGSPLRHDPVRHDDDNPDQASGDRDQADDPSTSRDLTPQGLSSFAFTDSEGARVRARAGSGTIAQSDTSVLAELSLRCLVRPWPALSKRFDPACMTYLRISDLYVRDGCEAELGAFLGALMARFDCHYVLLLYATHGRLHQCLAASGVFDAGIGPYFLPAPQTLHVVGRWHSPDERPPIDDTHRWELMPVDL